MKTYNTDKGITVHFGKDYETVLEDTGDGFALTLVAGFILFLILI